MSEEYVLAQDVVAVLKLMHREGYCIGNNEAMLRIFEELSNLKMVEAEPVVHAHWVIKKRHSVSKNPYMDDNYHAHATCSHCGFVVDSRNMSFGYADLKTTKFCPECGAHMDEEVADE